MNWQYLRYFEVVAREEHFTRAADKLHMTQSALSKSIDNLEKDIGIPLFEQYGRNIKLTRYGQIFYNHVSAATSEIEDGLRIIRNMVDTKSGEVMFASIFTIGATFIPDIIKGFQASHPGIKLKFYQKSTTDILSDVLDGTVDLGFCGEFQRSGLYQDIDCDPILEEELLLAVPADHPLAAHETVSFSEILDETFIGYTNNTGIIHSIQDTLNRSGFGSVPLKEAYQAAEDNTVASLVRAGLGIAFIADNPLVHRNGLSFLHVKDPYFSRTLYAVWRKNGYLSPAAKAFKYFVLAQASLSPVRGAGD